MTVLKVPYLYFRHSIQFWNTHTHTLTHTENVRIACVPDNICLNDSSTPVASRAEVSMKARLLLSANTIYMLRLMLDEEEMGDRTRNRSRGYAKEMSR